MVRLKEFAFDPSAEATGPVLRSIGYLVERACLQLEGAGIAAPYAKFVVRLVPPGAATAGRFWLMGSGPTIARVDVALADHSVLLAPEPERRAAALELVEEAVIYLRSEWPAGADELLDAIRTAWSSSPPYRFALTRVRKRHGHRWFRAYYAFGPDAAGIELEIEEPGGDRRTIPLREEDHFRPLWRMLPVQRFRSTPEGIVGEDAAGRQLGFVALVR